MVASNTRCAPSARIEAARIDEAIRVDTYEHYQDHIKDIQAWRQRTGI
jgi:hypothetical protein